MTDKTFKFSIPKTAVYDHSLTCKCGLTIQLPVKTYAPEYVTNLENENSKLNKKIGRLELLSEALVKLVCKEIDTPTKRTKRVTDSLIKIVCNEIDGYFKEVIKENL